MIIKNIIDEDFVNYKKSSMFIIFPYCTFKCDKENGNRYCQNWDLINEPNIDYPINKIIERYVNNPLSHSLVLGGLEPFESWDDLLELVKQFRLNTNDDIIIYTGFYPNEINDKISQLKQYKNIIIKFGRFKPNQQPHKDEILGVELANNEQYAERIS